MYRFNPGLLRVFKLCLMSVLCCHWFGCIWWLVSDLEMMPSDAPPGYYTQGGKFYISEESWESGENHWLPPLWLKRSPKFEVKYFHAFYWGAGIAFGMTPFDIEPTTTLETIVTTLLMCFGLLLNAFVISSFTSAFASIDSKNQLAGKQLEIIRNYLLLKTVPVDIRSRILEYFQYIFTSNQSMVSQTTAGRKGEGATTFACCCCCCCSCAAAAQRALNTCAIPCLPGRPRPASAHAAEPHNAARPLGQRQARHALRILR